MLAIGMFATIDVLIFREMLGRPIVGFNEVLQTAFAVAIASVLASGLSRRVNLTVDMARSWFNKDTVAWI